MTDKPRDFLHDYIDAAAEASDRARAVLLVMVTASVLAFAAYWNSRPDNWAYMRIHCIGAAYKQLYDAEQSAKTSCGANEVPSIGAMKPSCVSNPAPANSASKVQQALTVAKAQACADHYLLYDSKDAETFKQKLLSSLTDNTLAIRVPFFGITFDINDLGLIGGLTFSIILIWCRFILVQELNNLRRLFAVSKPTEREAVYRVLAMRQVLTVPPSLGSDTDRYQGWSWLITGLFFLPLTVHLLVFQRDMATLALGMTLSESGTLVGICCSSGFLIFMAFLTVNIVKLNFEINKAWTNQALELRKPTAT